MQESPGGADGRRIRSDAYSSFARIVHAARAAFAVSGSAATLKGIAADAKVGVATLYRHFPSRDALAAAVFDSVYTEEIEPMMNRFHASAVPRETLLDIADQLAETMRRERALITSIHDPTTLTTELLHRSDALFGEFVQQAQDAGNLRSDLTADDVVYLLAMTATAISRIALDGRQRRRYLSLLIDGLNPQQASALPPIHPDERDRD